MKTNDLIQEIRSLPVEERAHIAACILRSLNPRVPEVDQTWADIATKRLHDITTGAVQPVASDDVFVEIWWRLS